jgi:uncharacterized protein (DUF2062 family)
VIAESIVFLRRKVAAPVLDIIKGYYKKMLSLPDSPKKIAQGVALGFAFDFLPIPIISIPLSYLFARLTRCNTVAAVATVILFKLAVPVFYALNLMSGNLVLGDIPGPGIHIAGDSFISSFLTQLVQQGYPFLFGSFLNAVLAWLVVYTLIMCVMKHKRRRGA